MTRPTLRRLRDNIDAIAIGQTSLPKSQKAKRRILQREFAENGDPAIGKVLNQQEKELARQREALRYATPRRKRRSKPVPGRRRDFASPEGFNECGVQRGRSYSSRAGARHERKQEGFPDVMRHPTMIGIAALPLTADLAAETINARKPVRKTFDQLTSGKQVSGGFHMVLKTAAELARIFPEDELPLGCDPIFKPGEIFAYLHWHGVICDDFVAQSG